MLIPSSYKSHTTDILGENGILEKSFSYEFAQIAGFRNFLAHDYEKVEAEYICRKVMDKLHDIDECILQIEESIRI